MNHLIAFDFETNNVRVVMDAQWTFGLPASVQLGGAADDSGVVSHDVMAFDAWEKEIKDKK
jgi:hypothetical protein